MAQGTSVVEYDICNTDFGDCLFARTAAGFCRIDFSDAGPEVAVERLRADWPGAQLRRVCLSDSARAIFSGSEQGQVNVAPAGTPFQHRVWRALQRIPRGVTRTYGQVAADIGQPRAARAVGQAVGANPLAVLVPCHRVLPVAGGTGGYRWGAERKSALLAAEGLR
jgi:AraC family transcriptional regulator of adaptative response/methylated-DNA-[protein]-cysteine methyltransferase